MEVKFHFQDGLKNPTPGRPAASRRLQPRNISEESERAPMPVVPGKPGTIRVRGKVRAQCQVALAKMNELLAYQTKSGMQVPPPNPPFLSALNLASVTACQAAMKNLLMQKN